jgi:hypothetical protein
MIMHPMTNSIIVVTMVSLDSSKEASQTGRSPLLLKQLLDAPFVLEFRFVAGWSEIRHKAVKGSKEGCSHGAFEHVEMSHHMLAMTSSCFSHLVTPW